MKQSEQSLSGIFKERIDESEGVGYDEEDRSSLLDNDEIAAWEEGFMEGYDEAG